ncbi:MAG: hypothetical protein DWQ01_14055 [Planctomycetota bacterium]|nr:MAG: hypothetical protein DWQ01_14055 [Planctomycetota bacterium]
MRRLPEMPGLHSAEAFNPAFLHAFFERAKAVETRPGEFEDALRGRVIATVFEEPSTRTRLSFESAALRLGAGVITVADPRTSSASKGESLRDTARTVGGYADLIVWRHPADGASRLASQFAEVPVVNGGDGRLGHPTQTLVDLYTLWREWGQIEGRTIALMGDLNHGRTARSLAWGLSLLGARMVLLPAPGLAWEEAVLDRILARVDYRRCSVRHPMFRSWTGKEKATLIEPRSLVQGELFGRDEVELNHLDALYLTRLQRERGAEEAMASRGYGGLQVEQLADPLLKQTLLLHPLPRREELPEAVDEAPGARYFVQTRMGPIVRQAVFLALLRPDRWSLPALHPLPAGDPDPGLGTCPNTNCISSPEGIPVPWRVEGRHERHFLCAFCDAPLPVEYAGCRSTRKLHPVHSPKVMRILPENLRPFRERHGAMEAGYEWSGG